MLKKRNLLSKSLLISILSILSFNPLLTLASEPAKPTNHTNAKPQTYHPNSDPKHEKLIRQKRMENDLKEGKKGLYQYEKAE